MKIGERIETPRGTFKISAIFNTSREAIENDYHDYFTNDDGTRIFVHHIDEYHCKFGIIPKA